MLAPSITPRLYQEVIFSNIADKNALVVLPTGLGKTMIATMLIAHRLKHYPKSKIVFLAPTKPLIEQHFNSLQDLLTLDKEDFTLFTGTVPPAKRKALYETAKIIFTTPQTLENDVMSKRVDIKDVSLMIFDEAHRAVGNYAYVFLGQTYEKVANHAQLLALTASPGTDTEKIKEVCENLHIKAIEVRKETDDDVAPYVQEVDMKWVEIPFPKALEEVRKELQECYEKKLKQVESFGYLKIPISQVNKTTLLGLQGSFHGEMAKGNKSFELLKSISLVAEAMKVQHAIELVETQGIYSLDKYLDQLKKLAITSTAKATKNLVEDVQFKSAVHKTKKLLEEDVEHPKIEVVQKILLEKRHVNPDFKAILFTQYRDQAVNIEKTLQSQNIKSKVFVGQAKKSGTGLSQKDQQAMLQEFREGKFPVLIATSVAEEGLDIPKVDAVIFYEPVPSAIRTVQRRGRTGRLEKGEVIILVTKGTRDVGYRWVAHHKEQRMYRAITQVKKDLVLTKKELSETNKNMNGQTSLSHYETESKKNSEENKTLKIIADHREKGSLVLRSLIAKNIDLDLQQLSIGDFLLSDRCIVEYKTLSDFVNSIIDGRLLVQLKALKAYARPILLIEGNEDIYAQRQIHPNAIRGMLATITVGYGYGLIITKNAQESAEMLIALAKREQPKEMSFQYHSSKPQTENEQIEYLVSSIPGVGATLAKPLLQHFGTIKKLVNASVEELESVPGIGKKKAQAMHELFKREYREF